MTLLEIEKLARDSDKIELILEELQEEFDEIEQYEQQAKSNTFDDSSTVRKAFQLMDGIYGKLRRVLSIVEQESKEIEVKKYNTLIMDITDDKGKVTTIDEKSSSKQALEAAFPYYRVASRIRAYFDSCDKHFGHLQSILRKAEAEEDRRKGVPSNE